MPDDFKIQSCDDINQMSDVKNFDVRERYTKIVEPAIRLAHEFCKTNGIPHLFVAEVQCDLNVTGDSIGGQYRAHWANISPVRELCMFIGVQALTAKDQDEIGYRLGEILAHNPGALRMAFQALEKNGVVSSSTGLLSQTSGPQVTH